MPESATLSNISPAARARAHHLRLSTVALAALIACVFNTHAQKGPKHATDAPTRSAAAVPSGGDAKAGGSKTGGGKAGDVSVRERRAAPQSAAPSQKVAKDVAPDAPATKGGMTKTAGPALKDVDANKGVDAGEDVGTNNDAAVDDAAADKIVGAESVAAKGGVENELTAMRAKLEEAKPGAERARLRRAYVDRLVELNRKPEAVAELRAMTGEERFDPPYFYNAGNALARLGESGAAVEAYRKAISQRHGNYARAQHNLGVVLTRLGRWDEAQEALTAALRQENFTYAEASYNLGRLYSLRGEAGLAINEWTRTLKLQPDHAEAATALARALAEDGDSERALAVLDAFKVRRNTRGVDESREIAVTRGEILAAGLVADGERNNPVERGGGGSSNSLSGTSRRGGGGGETYREARTPSASLRPLAVDRQSYDLLQRARAAREAGDNNGAAALYQRVIRNSGGYFPPANLELGYALGSLRRNEEAVATLLLVTRKDASRYPIAFYHLGRFYEQLGQLAPAGDAFARAASLYGETNPQFLVDVSRVREKEGKTREALDAMENYVRISEQWRGVPDWARERVTKLREQVGTPPPVK